MTGAAPRPPLTVHATGGPVATFPRVAVGAVVAAARRLAAARWTFRRGRWVAHPLGSTRAASDSLSLDGGGACCGLGALVLADPDHRATLLDAADRVPSIAEGILERAASVNLGLHADYVRGFVAGFDAKPDQDPPGYLHAVNLDAYRTGWDDGVEDAAELEGAGLLARWPADAGDLDEDEDGSGWVGGSGVTGGAA